MRKKFVFDESLYKKCKNKLSQQDAKKIIDKYNKKYELKESYDFNFLSNYYSPILTILNHFFGSIKNKYFLEIGYRTPLFLEYLKTQGSIAYGIDIKPYVINKNFLKMSIEELNPQFLKTNKNKFHAIFERITLSKLYDKNYFLETGEHRFKNKKKILSNLYNLLKSKGILILQDDRGTIFSESQFREIGFKKVIKETPLIFKDKKGKNLGWNVLVVYQK